MSSENENILVNDSEIEDSLRVCEEIKGYLEEEMMNSTNEKSILEELNATKEEFTENENSVDVMSEVEEEKSDTEVETEETSETEEAETTAEENLEESEVTTEVTEEEVMEEEVLHEMDYSEKEEEEVVEEEIIPTTTDFEFTEERTDTLRKKYPLLFRFSKLIICVVIAFVLALCITKFVAYPTAVVGYSMQDTLNDGDHLIVEKISYKVNKPSRYDVVVFPYSNNSNYIKRVIGLPGETVFIRDGIIYIDGMPLKDDYGKQVILDPGIAAEEIVLDKDEYFVLGDNRNSSVDSRDASVGTVKGSEIAGKAWFRIYPFGEMGVVE